MEIILKCIFCGNSGGKKPIGFDKGYPICDVCIKKVEVEMREQKEGWQKQE